MQEVTKQLAEMANPDTMWNHYTQGLAGAQKDKAPTKLLYPKNNSWPKWMDRKT